MADDRAYEAPTLDRLLASLNNGDDNAAATEDYHRLVERLATMVESYGGSSHKGMLTLTFNFKADAKGVDVALQTKITMPKRPALEDRLFIGGSKGDVLTFKDPARGTFFEGSDLGRRRFGENN